MSDDVTAPAGQPPADPDGHAELGGREGVIAARTAKLERLRAAGIDPYPARSSRTHMATEASGAFAALEAEGATEGPTDVLLAGRLVGALRRMGGSAFVHLADGSGQIQLHVRRDRLGKAEFERFLADFDAGDFVNARGNVFRTRMGEVSLAVEQITLLAKSLLPLPEKWHGLKDVETRFRQRYLDLIANEDVRDRFVARSLVVSAMRRFLDERGFLEVETPVLQPIYGGGSAKPFTTFYNALNQEMFLRIADELYLKRLIVGGFERVYEICKDFRNEGIDRTHLPEFTQMECYWAYADYRDLMALTETMVAELAEEVNGSTRVEIDGRELDLTPPWARLGVRDAIQQATGIDIDAHSDLDSLRAAIAEHKLPGELQPTWAKTVDELLSEHVEPHLWAPTFLMDYPMELSPLAKRTAADPRYVERFEPFAAGMEIGNSFTELNDPLDQLARFEAMGRARDAGDDEADPMDTDFVEALMHGMPPTGGLGIGVDRLVMLLTGQSNIREVVLFPQLRTR
jgi:lysyl-tRNA synthetase class 2